MGTREGEGQSIQPFCGRPLILLALQERARLEDVSAADRLGIRAEFRCLAKRAFSFQEVMCLKVGLALERQDRDGQVRLVGRWRRRLEELEGIFIQPSLESRSCFEGSELQGPLRTRISKPLAFSMVFLLGLFQIAM